MANPILELDMSNTDISLLRDQKEEFWKVVYEYIDKDPTGRRTELLEGLGNFIDHIMDSMENQNVSVKNTKVEYLYRDANNYKVFNSVIIAGEITPNMETTIKEYLDCGEYFIPHIVGLPEEKFSEETEDDGPFFEWIGVSLTDAEPNIDVSARELVENFEINGNDWNLED